MRDNHYRKLCFFPNEYDKVIDWIAKNNPYFKAYRFGPDADVVSELVNSCIRSVVFGEINFASTGMCIAIRANSLNKK